MGDFYEIKLNQAEKNLENGNYAEAMDACNLVLEEDPEHTHALFIKASIQKATGKEVEAEQSINKVLQLDDKNYPAYQLRAEIYSELHKWKQAIADYKVLLKQKEYSDKHDCYGALGKAFHNLQNFQYAYFYTAHASSLCQCPKARQDYERLLGEIAGDIEKHGPRKNKVPNACVDVPDVGQDVIRKYINTINPARFFHPSSFTSTSYGVADSKENIPNVLPQHNGNLPNGSQVFPKKGMNNKRFRFYQQPTSELVYPPSESMNNAYTGGVSSGYVTYISRHQNKK